jgi:uncharacterized membrane protein
MATAHPDPVIADYLRRLEAAAHVLSAGRRVELVSEIRAHIDEAMLEAGDSDEATVRNVLERLGSPEEIVAEAAGPRPQPAATRGRLELAALTVLALSGIVPIVGWAVGVVLVMASASWSAHDKATGLAIGFLAALSVPALTIAAPAGGLGPIETFVLVGWGIVSGPVSAAYLAYRLHHRGTARHDAYLARPRTPGV